MKKITAIIGSPKSSVQSVTYTLTKRFLEALKVKNIDFEFESIQLSEKNILPCKGCLTCKQKGKCSIDDEMEAIRKSMSEADVLVFGSPVHFTHVSSVFQNFIERNIVPLHTFEYLGKPFINIITTNGSGEQEADKYLTKIGMLFGGIKIGSIFKSDNDHFKQKKFDNIVRKTISVLSGAKIKPALTNKIYFAVMKSIIRKNGDYFKAETEIWKEKGWFNKSYQKIYDELSK